MDDREMLYLAAEAARIKCNGHYPDKNGYVCLSSHSFSCGFFSPLDFTTGHALLLQARLAIHVDMQVTGGPDGYQVGYVHAYHDLAEICEDVVLGRAESAICRAIVKAAAAIREAEK